MTELLTSFQALQLAPVVDHRANPYGPPSGFAIDTETGVRYYLHYRHQLVTVMDGDGHYLCQWEGPVADMLRCISAVVTNGVVQHIYVMFHMQVYYITATSYTLCEFDESPEEYYLSVHKATVLHFQTVGTQQLMLYVTREDATPVIDDGTRSCVVCIGMYNGVAINRCTAARLALPVLLVDYCILYNTVTLMAGVNLFSIDLTNLIITKAMAFTKINPYRVYSYMDQYILFKMDSTWWVKVGEHTPQILHEGEIESIAHIGHDGTVCICEGEREFLWARDAVLAH